MSSQLHGILRKTILGLLATGFVSSSFAYEVTGEPEPLVAAEKPAKIEGIGIDQKAGDQLDLNLEFRDETGQVVKLGSYFDGKKPVIISPIYFNCPGLCNFHLNGFTEGLKGMDWNPGEKFQMLAVSFDSKETPEIAAGKKANYMKVYGRPGTENGWHFLTGDEANITALMKSIGFKYKWNEKDEEWSHASAAIVNSPTGKITRYLPGIMFEAKDIKLALNEATQGKIGNFVESLVLYCFQYSPHQSGYVLYAANVMKLGAALMVIVLAILLIPVWLRKSRREKEA